jgi:hypothetical protein
MLAVVIVDGVDLERAVMASERNEEEDKVRSTVTRFGQQDSIERNQEKERGRTGNRGGPTSSESEVERELAQKTRLSSLRTSRPIRPSLALSVESSRTARSTVGVISGASGRENKKA